MTKADEPTDAKPETTEKDQSEILAEEKDPSVAPKVEKADPVPPAYEDIKKTTAFEVELSAQEALEDVNEILPAEPKNAIDAVTPTAPTS